MKIEVCVKDIDEVQSALSDAADVVTRLTSRVEKARELAAQCEEVAAGIERMRLLPSTCAALVRKIGTTMTEALAEPAL